MIAITVVVLAIVGVSDGEFFFIGKRLQPAKQLAAAEEGGSRRLLTENLDNLLMTHGWTYSPYDALHFVGGVAFVHVPLSRVGRPYGGEHVENRIGFLALEDTVYGHTHRAVDKMFTKTGTNRSVRVISGGCSLEEGHIERYVGHAVSGWSYNIADLVIDGGRIRRCTMVPMGDLAESYGD